MLRSWQHMSKVKTIQGEKSQRVPRRRTRLRPADFSSMFHPHLPHQYHSHPDPSPKAAWPLTLPGDKSLLPPPTSWLA